MPNNIINKKTSNYNSKVYMDKCNLCNKKSRQNGALHTHHINFQKDCFNGFVKSKPYIKKNQMSNLVVLCEQCHNKVHDDKIIISGYKKTSNGIKLMYSII